MIWLIDLKFRKILRVVMTSIMIGFGISIPIFAYFIISIYFKHDMTDWSRVSKDPQSGNDVFHGGWKIFIFLSFIHQRDHNYSNNEFVNLISQKYECLWLWLWLWFEILSLVLYSLFFHSLVLSLSLIFNLFPRFCVLKWNFWKEKQYGKKWIL